MASIDEDDRLSPPSSLPLFHSHIVAMAGLEKATTSTVTSSLHNNEGFQSGLKDDLEDANTQLQTSLENQSVEPMSQSMSSGDSNTAVSPPCLPDPSNSLTLVPQPLVDSVLNSNLNDVDCVTNSNLDNGNKQNKKRSLKDSGKYSTEQDFDDFCQGSKLLQSLSSSVSATDNLLNKNELSSPNSHKLEKPSTWRKLTGDDGSYYWNVDTGATQYDAPSEMQQLFSDDEQFDSLDSSLADLEGAAFRYASLHLSDDNFASHEHDGVRSDCNASSDVGRMFSVQSLGWLPLDHFSANPETSSSEVNACIQHLSSTHSRITDGVGAWGEGKDLMLLIEDEDLKLLDPLSQTVLQVQPIKHIRVWGVGGNSPHEFAYVAKDKLTRQYKCHVFRCDSSAKAIAKELHNVCAKLSLRANKKISKVEVEKQKLAMSASMPVPKSETSTKFQVKYLGTQKVENVNGIQTVKNVIREITTNDQALCIECVAIISASALVVQSEQDNHELVNCRTRYLSFMGIGDDISVFAFIHVVGNEAKCHVLQCLPNAAKLALAVQEACMLRFQKAVDAKPAASDIKSPTPTNKKSFKRYFKNIFARKTHS